MVMNCHKIWSDIKLVPSCISFHTYFIKFHIPLSLYSFCGSKTADTNELVFTSELTFPVRLDGLIKFSQIPIAMSTTIGLLPNSGRNSSVKAMMKKNSMAFEEKQTNKQTAPLGATKYEKRNDQCFIVLKLALELSKYRYRGYLLFSKFIAQTLSLNS